MRLWYSCGVSSCVAGSGAGAGEVVSGAPVSSSAWPFSDDSSEAEIVDLFERLFVGVELCDIEILVRAKFFTIARLFPI